MHYATVVNYLSLIACVHARALNGLVSSAVKPLAKYTPSGSASSDLGVHTAHGHVPATSEANDDTSYWLADITHQGMAAFNSNPSSYTVFRNVKDYGAKGMLSYQKSTDEEAR